MHDYTERTFRSYKYRLFQLCYGLFYILSYDPLSYLESSSLIEPLQADLCMMDII